MARGAVSRKRRSQRRMRVAGQGLNEAPASTSQPTGLEAAPAIVASASPREKLGALERQYARQLRRETVLEVLTAAGVEPSGIQPTYELTIGDPAELLFLGEADKAGFRQVSAASWPCEAELGDHGDVLFRSDSGGVFRLDDGTLVLAAIRNGWAYVRVAAGERAAASDAVAVFSVAYPPLYREQDNEGLVPITFWSYGKHGPQSRLRMIEAGTWAEIDRNYSAGVQAELGRLMGDEFVPGKDGQLLLWQGEPGTGKTWALRALASEWSDWAEFHYITDPDAFFVSQPDYLIDVLLSETYDVLERGAPDEPDKIVSENAVDGKWRVLILEDTGELLSANAKEAYGQGLSRLLNVVDGMVGQGLKVLALVTTNDELGDLHPAAVRPGRCASQIEFGPLSAEEAAAWLGDDVQDSPLTLAELYARGEQAGVEAFAPADTAECSCGHLAEEHGGDGSGACMADGCDCPEFDLAAPDEDEEVVVAAATVELPLELQPGETSPEMRPSPAAPVAEQPVRSRQLAWNATFAPEGRPTEDGRIFAPGAISWRDLPLSLMAQLETEEGHDGAKVSGRIDDIFRDGSLIRATGIFDSGDFGQEVARLVDERVLRGLSVDLAIREFRVLPRSQVLDEDGNWIGLPDEAAEEPDLLELLFGPDEDEPVLFVVTDAVIGCATVCPFPAFAEAEISLAASAAGRAGLVWNITMPLTLEIVEHFVDVEPLSASAAGLVPVEPPAAWFQNPELEEPTAIVVTDDGQVYGHAADWGTCHIGFPDSCVLAPHSLTDYEYFHLAEVRCDDGTRVATGKITLGTDHADSRLGVRAATEHYDNTGAAVADVTVGEDEYGIWVAGALRPDVSEVRVRELRGSLLSGDWRGVNGNLEMIALLAVNVPGFPVPRARALVAASEDGQQEVLALVAAGIVCDCPEVDQADIDAIEALRVQASGELAELVARARGEE